jgi:hypothetical protein
MEGQLEEDAGGDATNVERGAPLWKWDFRDGVVWDILHELPRGHNVSEPVSL